MTGNGSIADGTEFMAKSAAEPGRFTAVFVRHNLTATGHVFLTNNECDILVSARSHSTAEATDLIVEALRESGHWDYYAEITVRIVWCENPECLCMYPGRPA